MVFLFGSSIYSTRLVLQDSQTSLNNDVLEDRTRWDINGTAFRGHDDDGALQDNTSTHVDITSDSQVVQLDNLWDAWNSLLELGNLLEVAAKLDQWCWTETVGVNHQLTMLKSVQVRLDKHKIGAGLDWQETSSWNIDTVSILEVTDGSTDSSLELDNRNIGFSLLVSWDRLVVRNDLHGKLIGLNNTLDSSKVHPDVVGVEVLELLDRLELVDILLWHLSDFKEADVALVVDNCTTLDISLGLVGQFHDVLGLGLDHVLQNAEIDNGTQVIGVGQEDDLDTALKELVKNARVVERFEDISVAWWVPVGKLGVVGLWCRKEGVFQDTWVAGLVEGKNVDVVTFVLLNDGLCV